MKMSSKFRHGFDKWQVSVSEMALAVPKPNNHYVSSIEGWKHADKDIESWSVLFKNQWKSARQV